MGVTSTIRDFLIMHRVHDRDVEAEQNIDIARRNISSVALGAGSWDNGFPKYSDAGEAFRLFTKKEMQEVKGAMSKEVQADLRAVHFRYGFGKTNWESEAMRGGKQTRPTTVPERNTKNLQVTQFRLGSKEMEIRQSRSQADLKQFTKAELDGAKGAISDAVRKDLRAVHIFAPFDKNDWQSEATKMAEVVKNTRTRRPERQTMNNRGTNMYLSDEPTSYISDSKSDLRWFTPKEMQEVQGAMAKEVQDDLRAVHFRLGTDKTVLDRDIKDRPQSGPVRPHSAAPLGRARLRPRSAFQ